jgi:hypothetical protein
MDENRRSKHDPRKEPASRGKPRKRTARERTATPAELADEQARWLRAKAVPHAS